MDARTYNRRGGTAVNGSKMPKYLDSSSALPSARHLSYLGTVDACTMGSPLHLAPCNTARLIQSAHRPCFFYFSHPMHSFHICSEDFAVSHPQAALDCASVTPRPILPGLLRTKSPLSSPSLLGQPCACPIRCSAPSPLVKRLSTYISSTKSLT